MKSRSNLLSQGKPRISAMQTYTAESVTEGHPDKICDQISDRILDEILLQDSAARVAVETLATTGLVHVVGEVTTEAYVEIPQLVRSTLVDIGYTSSEIGLDGDSCGVLVSIGQQSSEIAAGVSRSLEVRGGSKDTVDSLGAGDQGMMYGFACDENDALMPSPIHFAHLLSQSLAKLRRDLANGSLRPDGKTQVTIQYDGFRPVAITNVVVSAQHSPAISQIELSALLRERLVLPVLEASNLDFEGVEILINPSGSFVVGGPQGDAGLTGRKIIVDTYGGMARHGGGAFSGKDPSKVDRSAAYAMRWVAKNIVAAGLASRAETRVSYAIGKAKPVSFDLDTFGTEVIDKERIRAAALEVFDLRPAAIIEALDLRRPIYFKTSSYGHFGRQDVGFPWEDTSRAAELIAEIG